MQQSNFIFGVILIAFIVFITVRGELPDYISLLRGQKIGDVSVGQAQQVSGSGILDQGASLLDSAISNGIDQNSQDIISIFDGGLF